jgi:hypothetical protein
MPWVGAVLYRVNEISQNAPMLQTYDFKAPQYNILSRLPAFIWNATNSRRRLHTVLILIYETRIHSPRRVQLKAHSLKCLPTIWDANAYFERATCTSRHFETPVFSFRLLRTILTPAYSDTGCTYKWDAQVLFQILTYGLKHIHRVCFIRGECETPISRLRYPLALWDTRVQCDTLHWIWGYLTCFMRYLQSSSFKIVH